MMEQQELATARYHNIPVFVLVLRNNAYGGMKRDQLKNYDGRVIGTELFARDKETLDLESDLRALFNEKAAAAIDGFSCRKENPKMNQRPWFERLFALCSLVVAVFF